MKIETFSSVSEETKGKRGSVSEMGDSENPPGGGKKQRLDDFLKSLREGEEMDMSEIAVPDERDALIREIESSQILKRKSETNTAISSSTINVTTGSNAGQSSTEEKLQSTQKSEAASGSSEETKKEDEMTLYSKRDHGPYVVYFMYEDDQWNDIKLGKLLQDNNRRFESIYKINKKKARVTFLSATDANNVIKMAALRVNDIKAMIPRFFAEKIGVIYDVPLDMTNETISKAISSSVEIKAIERMKRFSGKINGKDTFMNTTSIKIRFLGDRLPESVRIHGACRRVKKMRESVLQCYRCYKFGHSKTNCGSQQQICRSCAQELLENHNCEEKKCGNCGSSHDMTNRNCPEYKKQAVIKELVTEKRVSFWEAAEMVKDTAPPKDFKLDLNDVGEFPQLGGYKTRGRATPKSFVNVEEIRKNAAKQQSQWNALSQNPQIPWTPIGDNPHKVSDFEKVTYFLSEIMKIIKIWGFSVDDVNHSERGDSLACNAGEFDLSETLNTTEN